MGEQYIIGRYAGLPRVQAFSESNTTGCELQVRCFVYDTGAFAAQLQRDRRKVCGGF